MVNALREISELQAIEVRLQSNEVLVSAPTDVPLSALYGAIKEAGFSPDDKLWLTANGAWMGTTFQPEGWKQPIPVGEKVTRPMQGGPWKLLFEKSGDDWTLIEAGAVDSIPQVKDIDAK